MKLLRACLLLSLLVGHLSCVWAASIVLDEHPRGLLLNDTGQLLWLADYSGALTLDDVRGTEHAARFVPLPAQRRHGEDVRPHWFKVELEQRAASGITESLLRIAVGLEAVVDLQNDLDRGLSAF